MIVSVWNHLIIFIIRLAGGHGRWENLTEARHMPQSFPALSPTWVASPRRLGQKRGVIRHLYSPVPLVLEARNLEGSHCYNYRVVSLYTLLSAGPAGTDYTRSHAACFPQLGLISQPHSAALHSLNSTASCSSSAWAHALSLATTASHSSTSSPPKKVHAASRALAEGTSAHCFASTRTLPGTLHFGMPSGAPYSALDSCVVKCSRVHVLASEKSSEDHSVR